jgi:hypothetical protein
MAMLLALRPPPPVLLAVRIGVADSGRPRRAIDVGGRSVIEVANGAAIG